MKRKYFVMAAVISVLLMTVPLWGALAQSTGATIVYTLLLDGGHIGGNFDDVVIVAKGGENIHLPTPEREGYAFRGWQQLSVYGGYEYTSYSSGAEVDIVHKVYIATWNIQNLYVGYNIISPAGGNFTVTFILAGGNVSGNTGNVFVSVTSPAGLLMPADIPFITPPALSAHEFMGWRVTNTSDAPMCPAALSTVNITGNMSFTAVWDPPILNGNVGQEPVATPAPVEDQVVNLYFYLGGGTADGAVDGKVVVPFTITSPSALIGINNVPVPARGRNFEFRGWQIRGGDGAVLSSAEVAAIEPGSTIIFDAAWQEIDVFFEVVFHPGDTRVGASLYPLSPGALYTQNIRLDAAITNADIPQVILQNDSFWVHMGWQVTRGNPSSAAQPHSIIGHIVTEDVEFTAEYFVNIGFDLFGNGHYQFRALRENSRIGDGVEQTLLTPSKDGYRFTGWYTNNPAVLTSGALSSGQVADITVTASRWIFVAAWERINNANLTPATPSPVPTPTATPTPQPTPQPTPVPAYVTVRFNPGIGSLPANASNTITGPFGFRVVRGNIPTPIPPHGYTFIGWFMHGVEVRADFAAIHDVTLYAHFQRTITGPLYFTITFDTAGGVLAAGVSHVQTVADGTVLTTLPSISRAGYNFVGWHNSANAVNLPFTVRRNTTFVAKWVSHAGEAPMHPQAPCIPPVIPCAHLKAVFNPAPGRFPCGENGVRTGPYGFVISSIPQPTRPGYRFVGWHVGGAPIGFPITVRSDMSIGAHWVSAAALPPAAGAVTCTQTVVTVSTEPGIRENPQTGPLQVSFGIFGAVMMLGLGSYGALQLKYKQKAAAAQYQAGMARLNREQRIIDLVGKGGDKGSSDLK